ncbi:MAG: hypothetical protein ISS79_04810, partial [Phycisphaerae bacterium]|nr:hypothetical protein [Phycisphaerae bacterium]
FDFLSETFLPAISTGGFRGSCKLMKHGFYPAGGGKMTFSVEPRQEASQAIELCRPEKEFQIHARIYTARLPAQIARRQEKLLLESALDIADVEHIEAKDSDGPGNCVMIRLLGSGRRTTLFTTFGQRGKPSEKVVGEVVSLAEDFLASGAAADRFLADQLLIYMAILKSGAFTTSGLPKHLLTNIEVIKEFVPVEFSTEKQGRFHRVSCQSA